MATTSDANRGDHVQHERSNNISHYTSHDSTTSDHIATRSPPHLYLFRRPRALQYTYNSRLYRVGDEDAEGTHTPGHAASNDNGNTDVDGNERVNTDAGLEKHRERIDLFIDLIWVGIISNLTSVFSSIMFDPNEYRAGTATAVFILLFVASWRIWNLLREFVNNYYMDDGLQRTFLVWILVLSLFYGNNLAYLSDYFGPPKTVVIGTYLVIRASFVAIEVLYSIYIPWLRRINLFSHFTYIPATAFWVAAIFTTGTTCVVLLILANIWDYVAAVILQSRIADRFVPHGYKKALDPEHVTSRMNSFYIIIIGEGVLLLIKNGPLGQGINSPLAVAVWALVAYFFLVMLYFNRDMSKYYIPAVTHRGLLSLNWLFFHIPLFSGFLTLSAAVLYMITGEPEKTVKTAKTGDKPTDEEEAMLQHRAIWVVATSLATMMFSLTVIALMDTSLDKPKTLLVTNRYVRLLPRIIYVIIVCLVPLKEGMNDVFFFGIATLLLLIVYMWEWLVSLERTGKVFEPKSAAPLSLLDHNRKNAKKSEA